MNNDRVTSNPMSNPASSNIGQEASSALQESTQVSEILCCVHFYCISTVIRK